MNDLFLEMMCGEQQFLYCSVFLNIFLNILNDINAGMDGGKQHELFAARELTIGE